MALNASYDAQDDIPEAFRELFTEREGKWELTGIAGMKTQADVDRVQTALEKERGEHKETKTKLKTFEHINLEQFDKDQTEIVELRAKVEAGAGDGFDEAKFNEAVDKLATSRVATETAPLRRELDQMTERATGLETENGDFRQEKTNRIVTDAVRSAATGIKVIDTAVDDVLMLGERVFQVAEDGTVLTKEGVGVTPGIAPDIWLSEMQAKKPHWWPASTGGGANGSGQGSGFSSNPFSSEHWNLTEQGKAMREDPTKADQMAKAAGTKVGGLRPAAKSPVDTQRQ